MSRGAARAAGAVSLAIAAAGGLGASSGASGAAAAARAPSRSAVPARAPHRPPGFRSVRHAYRPTVRFAVTYAGRGTFATSYRSEPPNPGGSPDHNTAQDSSAQSWALRYRTLLAIPPCGPAGRRSPCRAIGPLAGATGRTSASGRVAHVHLDGLYSSFNQTVDCTQRIRTPRGALLNASIDVRYEPREKVLAITALDPVATVLNLLPGQCPSQGDPVDGLYDNYYTPGFSFAPGYGPDRWFTSRTVRIPIATLHRSARITIRLHETRAGTPPRNCAVRHPTYEQCSTGGSWRGVLRLIAR